MRHIEAPESVKYWRGYDPSDPPDYEDDYESEAEEEPVLLLRYPVWDMTFSEYGNLNGWEVPS